MASYVPRTLQPVVLRAAETFPAVVVTGPRQSGKTTLLRHLFGESHRYCSLDDPSHAALARSDPALLLERFPPPVILDEVQAAPGILPAVKAAIDTNRGARGRFLLTGSQAFAMMQGVTESLAGRAAILSLQSLSLREVFRRADGDVGWREALGGRSRPEAPLPLLGRVLRGGYPDAALSGGDARLWHASYVQSYLERDVRSLRAVGDLGDFQRFLVALAARSGGLLNAAELGRDLGISAKTVTAWVSVLEASGQAITLRPWFENVGKRLVKHPKVYFTDTGTLAWLLGIESEEQALQGVAAGPLFETAVLGQLLRLRIHRGEVPRLHFWRTADGHEVDFLIEAGRKLIPIEAKITATPNPRQAEGIERFQALVGARAEHGLVVCLCEERQPLTRTVDAVPLGAF